MRETEDGDTASTVSESSWPPIASPEAEDAVISAAILTPDCIGAITQVIDARHWYFDSHRWIWTAVIHLWRESKIVDSVTVANELRAMGRLDQVGGTTEIARIIDTSPAVANVSAHAELIRDAFISRETAHALRVAESAIRSRGKHWREALADLRDGLKAVREQ